MTLFEYIAIAFSLVYSFAVLRLLGGLSQAIMPRRMYWVHLVFVITALLYVINAFWGFWSYSGVTWSYPLYIAALLTPTIQYFLTTVLIPGQPAEVPCWRDYYFSVRRRFFAGLVVLGLAGLLSNTVLVDMSPYHPARFGQVGTLAIGSAGLVSSNPSVHAGLAVASLLGVVAFGVIILAQPGGLG